jgi:hypothetical protein
MDAGSLEPLPFPAAPAPGTYKEERLAGSSSIDSGHRRAAKLD